MRIPAACAVLVLLIAGCSEQTDDASSDGDERPTTTTEADAPPATDTPSETPDTSGLAGVQPCDIVDAAGAASLGLTDGVSKTLGEARVCQWRYEGATLDQSFTVSLALFETRGLAAIVGTEITTLPDVGTHPAASFVAPGGSCGVSVGVGDDARVDSTATGGDPQQACDLAAQLAALAEPNLP